MASKISKKQTLSVKGILSVENDIPMFEFEEMEPVALIDLIRSFDGQEVSLSVSYVEEL